MESLRIGAVEIAHDDETAQDHLTCVVCRWSVGISPREYAVRLARRHDASHQGGTGAGASGRRR